MKSTAFLERGASGRPDGLLVLHHGRGSDEVDLIGLADMFDPERRLHVVSPRAPLQIQGQPGYHWYVVPEVGRPDYESFHAAYEGLAQFHDELWQRTGLSPEQTVLGGFSMGSVMSFSMGLGADRPSVAGILGFSGFIPIVDRWAPDLERHAETKVLIAHGRLDPVISIGYARSANELLTTAGLDVKYLESDIGHQIDPAHIQIAGEWLQAVIAEPARPN